jgi:hypothetical protein
MPAKGKSKVTDEQRKRIAAGKLLRKTSREIAHETGLAKSTVDKQAGDPRTATFVLQMRRSSQPVLEKAWKLSVESILAHLRSKKAELQIQGRRDLLKFATAGDPPLLRVAPSDNSDGDFTLQQLLEAYAKASESQHAETKRS